MLSPSLGLKSLQCCQPGACCLLLPTDILVGLGVCRASVTGSAPSRFTFQSNSWNLGAVERGSAGLLVCVRGQWHP